MHPVDQPFIGPIHVPAWPFRQPLSFVCEELRYAHISRFVRGSRNTGSCGQRDSNPHRQRRADFKSAMSAIPSCPRKPAERGLIQQIDDILFFRI